MKRKRYSAEQIFAVVKLNQLGTPVPYARKLGVAEQAFGTHDAIRPRPVLR
jgi:hypothetical protein